jgi:hypothetical protein
MNLFSRFFSHDSEYELQLEESYAKMYQHFLGMSMNDFRVAARDLISAAKKELKRSGTDKAPHRRGDQLLADESTDPSIRENFAKIRTEGVTDEDIRWFYDLPPIERVVLEMIDQEIQMAHLLSNLDKGMTEQEAGASVRKYHPIYGDPMNTTYTTGDDRPLPPELFNRVNNYRWERIHKDPDQYKRDLQQFSTFNALIRQEIRNGRL